MKAWAIASRIGLQSTWGKVSFGHGRARCSGPRDCGASTAEFHVAAHAVLGRWSRKRWLARAGSIYAGRPLPRVTRDDLMATVRPDWREAIALARSGGKPALKRSLLRMVPGGETSSGPGVAVNVS